MMRIVQSLLAAAAVAMAIGPAAVRGAGTYVYFGSNTNNDSRGFYRSTFDMQTGALGAPELLVHAVAPSYYVFSADHKHIYSAVSGTSLEGKSGGVSAYAVDGKTGAMTLLNTKVSGGGDTCFVSLDKEGKHVLASNYQGGSVVVFPINADGSLGEKTAFVQHTGTSVNKSRQNHAYAHSIRIDPTGKFALVADLGLDKFFVYKFDAGMLTANDPPFATVKGGEGPRHFYFHPQHPEWVYLLTEMASTIHFFHWDAEKGVLDDRQEVSALPADYTATNNTSAEIMVHPSGKFLYATNRGNDTVGEFAIDPQSGMLMLIGHVKSGGRTPRNFEIDPTGKWLLTANQGGATTAQGVGVFEIDSATGKLAQKGDTVPMAGPFCPRFWSAP